MWLYSKQSNDLLLLPSFERETSYFLKTLDSDLFCQNLFVCLFVTEVTQFGITNFFFRQNYLMNQGKGKNPFNSLFFKFVTVFCENFSQDNVRKVVDNVVMDVEFHCDSDGILIHFYIPEHILRMFWYLLTFCVRAIKIWKYFYLLKFLENAWHWKCFLHTSL